MNILHTEASLGWGGQEIRILRESLGMIQRGHEVIIAAHPRSSLIERAKDAGVPTVPVVFERRRFPSVVCFLKRMIEQKRIDVVNTHSSKDSWLGLPAARFASNRPLALRTRHLSTPIGKTALNSILYEMLPHMVMTTGEAIRRQMISHNGYRSDKIVSVPTGVDMTEFSPDAAYHDLRAELHLPQSTVLIGTISVIRSWKGIDYLVKAMPLIVEQFADVRCIVAGEGPHRASLQRTIAETGIHDRVYLLGHREDVRDVLRSLNILVHPSYGHEGVPQTILQAMAMAIPVIASDIEPLREVVRHKETGLLATARDHADIARHVVMLLRDKGLAEALGKNGRIQVETAYSLDKMLDVIEAVYRELNRL